MPSKDSWHQPIQTINGVTSAEVNLVLPNAQDQLFSNSTQAATASVLLGGSSLDAGSVRGIAQLVSSSVPGLSLNKVTITGADGSLLWPNANATSSGGLLAQESAQQKYDSTMSNEVDAMLAQTLGAGKAQVIVNADVNANQSTQEQLVYAKKGVPLTQQTSTETLKGGNPSVGGTAGTAGNITGAAATSSTGASNSSYKNQTTNTSYGVNKTIIHTSIAPGAVTSQSVSVLVDKSVPASAIPAIKTAVSNAVGLTPSAATPCRSVSWRSPRPPPPPPPRPPAPAQMMGYAKYGTVGLGLPHLPHLLRPAAAPP